MTLREAIVTAWKMIELAGYPRPWPDATTASAALDTWARLFGDQEPERVVALATAWLRSPESKYNRWPAPGALLHALGTPEAVDDADTAWAEVLGLVRARGQVWCTERVPDAPALADLRERMALNAERLRGKGDALGADEQGRRLAVLPAGDEYRLRAVYAGLAAVGGWRGVALADEETLMAHRASFRGAYRAMRTRVAAVGQEAQVAALLGAGRPALRALPGGRDGGR